MIIFLESASISKNATVKNLFLAWKNIGSSSRLLELKGFILDIVLLARTLLKVRGGPTPFLRDNILSIIYIYNKTKKSLKFL